MEIRKAATLDFFRVGGDCVHWPGSGGRAGLLQCVGDRCELTSGRAGAQVSVARPEQSCWKRPHYHSPSRPTRMHSLINSRPCTPVGTEDGCGAHRGKNIRTQWPMFAFLNDAGFKSWIKSMPLQKKRTVRY